MRYALAALVALALVVPPVAHARITKVGRGTAVSVMTSATALDDTSVSNQLPRYVTVCNLSSNGDVFIGDATVTTATGLPLGAGKCWYSGERVDADVQVYAIAASTQVVRVSEVL